MFWWQKSIFSCSSPLCIYTLYLFRAILFFEYNYVYCFNQWNIIYKSVINTEAKKYKRSLLEVLEIVTQGIQIAEKSEMCFKDRKVGWHWRQHNLFWKDYDWCRLSLQLICSEVIGQQHSRADSKQIVQHGAFTAGCWKHQLGECSSMLAQHQH